MNKDNYFKSKIFFAVIFLLFVLVSIIFFLRQNAIEQAKNVYILGENEKSNQIARTLTEKFKMSYETIRTVSLLPGVKMIEEPGQVLSKDAVGSIQQLYNNAYVNIQLSEIYVLPKNFDFKNISKQTGKAEEPLAVFDELITEEKMPEAEAEAKVEVEDKSQVKLEEVEDFEYALQKEQLIHLEKNYPTNKSFEKLNVPMISGAEVVTCDNSDFSAEDLKNNNDHERKGIILTVPKYDLNGKLNGAVSAILRTKVIESYLPDSYYGLINEGHNVKMIKKASEAWVRSTDFFKAGKNNPDLIYSKVINIEMPDLHPWQLWIALPNELFYQSESYLRVQQLFAIELIFALIFVFSIYRSTFKNFIRTQKVKDISENLAVSSDKLNVSSEELNDAAQAIKMSTLQQASSTAQVASAVEEISQMAKRTAANVEDLLAIAEKSYESANRSKDNISNLAEALNAIEKSEGMILSRVELNSSQLNEIMHFITEIKEKTKLIDDIVFQTKLLSFNASVEAARAGEHGKGFAVVAEEVGKLAGFSGAASREINEKLSEGINKISRIISDSSESIKQLVDDSSKNLEHGLSLSQSCMDQLQAMAGLAEDVKRKVIDTQNAIREQELGLSEIAKSSNEFHLSVEENKSKCEKTSDIADELVTNSKDIKEIIFLLGTVTRA